MEFAEATAREQWYPVWAERGYTKGCEVGVRYGDNAKALCDAIPGLELILVDPYMVYEYKHFRKRNKWKWDKPTMDSVRFKALKHLARYNVIWIMLPSHLAAQGVEDSSLDFVYIDGNHSFPVVMDDILLWSKKVRKGGVLSGHDYGIRSVRAAVNNFAKYTRRRVAVESGADEEKGSTVKSWIIEL